MSLSFEGGKPFPNDHLGKNNVTARAVRQAIIQTSQYFSGEAILTPKAEVIAQNLGVSSAALTTRRTGPKKFIPTIEHVTGLTVMRAESLILFNGEEATFEPLRNQTLSEPVSLTPEEVASRSAQIAELARDLPSDVARQIGQELSGE